MRQGEFVWDHDNHDNDNYDDDDDVNPRIPFNKCHETN